MKIEDELKKIPVPSSSQHRTNLRVRLLAHHDEVTMKKKSNKRLVFLLAAPMTALALMAVVAVLPELRSDQPIVQQTIEKLTPQQVLAAAAEKAEKDSELSENTVFYQKLLARYYSGYCIPYQEYSESYIDRTGKTRKIVRSNIDNKVISIVKFGPDGAYASENNFDRSALDPAHFVEGDKCPEIIYSESDNKKYMRHLEAVAVAYGYGESIAVNEEKGLAAGYALFLKDLQSGNPKDQARAFKKVSALNDWKVTENVKRSEISEQPLVELSFVAGQYYEKLYFHEGTLAFAGMESKLALGGPMPQLTVVLEQGIRPIEEIQ